MCRIKPSAPVAAPPAWQILIPSPPTPAHPICLGCGLLRGSRTFHLRVLEMNRHDAPCPAHREPPRAQHEVASPHWHEPRGRVDREQLAAVKDQIDDRREIESVADLTLGEHIRLIERPDNWQRLGLHADRAVFVRELDTVRQLRNDIMHFDSDTITDSERRSLRNFVQFLHDLRAFQAPEHERSG